MVASNTHIIEPNVQELIENFEKCLGIFIKWPAFNKPGQLDFHSRTIKLRRSAGSATNALKNDDFLWSLYETLRAWGMDSQGANRSPYPEFKNELQSKTNLIADLDGLRLDDPQLDIQNISSKLWQIMKSLKINQDNTKLVACSKALHHLLPDLVVPIDRTYTGVFFNKDNYAFQFAQEKFLSLAMDNFAIIARAVNPAKFVVDKGWNTCLTKVIDNAIVGYREAQKRNIHFIK
jgi:hypothetical protein